MYVSVANNARDLMDSEPEAMLLGNGGRPGKPD